MPCYQCVSRPDDKPGAWPTGRYYAALLGSARMAFQGTALGYVTAKTFEIPACGAALVTNWEPEMRDLGFCDAINCIVVNEKTLVPEVTRWLEDDDGLAWIATAGHALIQRKHTTTARAAQLVKRLRKLI
jgi:spore maturation protein CgeB